MEILILIVVGIVVFLVAFRSREHGSDGYAPRPKTERPKPSRTVENLSQRKPFDPATAKEEAVPLSVTGRARIVDGDTIVIKKTQIRLFGIDAPEIDHPYGQKAKWALIGLCKGRVVRAEILETDDYGRTVAKCFLPDGRDLSAEMVKLGLAIDWPKFSGGMYRHLEVVGARKKMWLADARQKGFMHVWKKFESQRASRS